MANEFIARNGLIAQNNSTISGSLIVSGSTNPSLIVSGNITIQVANNGNGPTLTIGPGSSNAGVGILTSGTAYDYIGIPSYNTLLQPGLINIYAASNIAGYTQANGDFQFRNNSTNLMYLSNNAKLGINTISPSAQLHVKGAGATSATNTLYVENSNLSSSLTIRDDGYINISGSLNVISGITGSLYGTSSFASTASYYRGSVTSASFASTASYVNLAQTASYVLNAVSSSFASTSSYVNPLNQNVRITGNGATSGTNALYVENSTPTNLLTVRNDGHIGIGTSSPATLLHVNGTTRIDNAGSTPSTLPAGPSANMYYGSGGLNYLSDPSVWLKINVGGTDYVFPGY